METAAEEVEEPLVDSQKVEEEGMEMEPEPVPEPEPASVDVATAGTAKRKRGRPPKKNKAQTVRPPAKKKEEEDVCFVCFDGGNLVVCDRRGCPKVYHPPCVNRDESFFETSGRWTCGWHICSVCEKAVHYMCYTCTYSLCKRCIKEAGFLCIRGNKGFCESCYRTVKLIELEQHTNEKKVGLDFDDKSSFNYLFKEYWFDLKRKLSITLEELNSAKNSWKGSGTSTRHGESSDELYDANDELEDNSDSSSGRHEGSNSSRKKVRRRPRVTADEDSSVTQNDCEGNSMPDDDKWATPALLEFVAHMKGGDESVVSQFDVQELLLAYITRNKLRDPRRKSQIICDSRLQNLFGKARVGHFEMLKLIESHFLLKEGSHVVAEENQGGVVDPDFSQADAEGYNDAATKMGSDKRRKIRKRVEERELQTNLDDYAAIDVHNVKLIYLRRNLVEDLLDDVDNFNEKVVNSFVRIRISGADQRQDLYRLVQVVGAQKTAETYKSGRRTTDIKLEILNLNKLEVITIDSISNQEFTEEECKRLRQSIKLGLINRLTVGDIQEKARVLQAVRVNDWLESEKLRLGHLRDRASETGRRKELRECVEKLQLLSTPEERRRRLNEVPDIHTDPKMNPEYESDDEGETGDKNQDNYKRSRESSFLRKGREPISPRRGGPATNWGASRKSSNSYWNQGKDMNQTGSWDATQTQTNAAVSDSVVWNNNQPTLSPRQPYGVARETSPASLPTGDSLSSNTCDENEKTWNYRDPSGKVQGPFSMTQLRKWSTTGYFPPDLRIWRASENQEDSILLADALNGNFEKDLPQWEPQTTLSSAWPAPKSEVATPRGGKIGISPKGWELSKDANAWSGQPQGHSSHGYDGQHSKWSSSGQQAFGDHLNAQPSNNSRNQWGNDSFNLPTPTPQLSNRGWHAAQGPVNTSLSPIVAVQTVGSGWGTTPITGINGALQSPTATMEHKGAAPVVNSRGGWGSSSIPPSCIDSSTNDLGGGLNKKQFFESDCPSPTPRSESHEHPALQRSEGNMSPIAGAVDRTSRPIRSAMQTAESSASESTSGQQQAPNRWEHDQTQKPEPISSGPSDTVGGEWSLPSPTPSTKPSTWNTVADSKPLVSSNGSRQATPSQPQVSTSTELAQAGWGTSTVSGPAQGNANWGIAIQGNTNAGWGTMAQGNANGAWATPAQGNANVTVGLGTAASQGSMGWGAPQGNMNASTGWGMAMQGSSNANVGWVAPAPIPAAGTLNPGWAQPMQGVPNQISPAVNAAGWGTGLVNANAGWGSQAGNPNSFSPQQTQNGEWHRGGRGGDSGHGGGRNDRTQHGSGGSSRPPPRGQGQRSGICKFHENGHCRKGASCNYIHS